MDYCLCIPEGSGIILDDALSERTTGVYPVTEHHMIIRFLKAFWAAFSHSSSYSTGHTQLRGLTYNVCSVIPLRRVTVSSECVFNGDKIFCKSTILSNLWERFPSRVSFTYAITTFSYPPIFSCDDFCFSWEPGSELTARTVPQESFWHLFPGTFVNLSEGQGVQAGGGMRECPTANLAVVGSKLQPEW